MPDDLRHIATEVFQSIPPAVRTGVFIDVFTPCDWHHAARCMVDYAGILDDPREPFAPACDMPAICTTAVTEKTVISDVRPLAYLPTTRPSGEAAARGTARRWVGGRGRRRRRGTEGRRAEGKGAAQCWSRKRRGR